MQFSDRFHQEALPGSPGLGQGPSCVPLGHNNAVGHAWGKQGAKFKSLMTWKSHHFHYILLVSQSNLNRI